EHVRGDPCRRRARLRAQRAVPRRREEDRPLEREMTAVLNAPVVADVPVRPFEPGPAGTHITIRGLTKYFAGWPLYEDFDLDIPKHKIVSVFGPNGCGRLTLINVIDGIVT